MEGNAFELDPALREHQRMRPAAVDHAGLRPQKLQQPLGVDEVV